MGLNDQKQNTVSLHSGEPRVGHVYEDHGAAGPIEPSGMHSDYWVLSDEERAKGFIRPVRHSYAHSGARPQYPTRELTPDERERYEDYYELFEVYPSSMAPCTGRFWTGERLASGCGSVTKMGRKLAETYARDPKFYRATFCCHCQNHFPVDEFVWDGTTEVVGS